MAKSIKRIHSIIVMTLAMIAIISSSANADVGLPMIYLVWPASWVLLPVIIILEALVAKHMLHVGWKSLKISAVANIVSTIVGIPITWFMLLVGEIVLMKLPLQGVHLPSSVGGILTIVLISPWLIPDDQNMHWMVYAAAAAHCIPFFFMSVWCECKVACLLLKEQPRKVIKRWAWRANLWSYGLIILCLVGAAIYQYNTPVP